MRGGSRLECAQCGARVEADRTVFSDGDRICPECFEALRAARREAALSSSVKPNWVTAAGLGFLLGVAGVGAALLVADFFDAVSGLSIVLPSAGVAYGVFIGSGFKRGFRVQLLAVLLAAAFYVIDQYALFTLAHSRAADPPRLAFLDPRDFLSLYVEKFAPLDPVFFGLGLFIAVWVPRPRKF